MKVRDIKGTPYKCDLDSMESTHVIDAPSRTKPSREPTRPLAHFVPQPRDRVKIVCVNIHVFQDGAGLGNYRVTDFPRIRQILDWTNGHFLAVQPPSTPAVPNPPAPTINSSHIGFRLNRLEFYQDQSLYQVTSVGQLQLAAVTRDPTTLSQLNIYLPAAKPTPGAAGGWATWPPTTVPTFDSWVVCRVHYREPSQPNWQDSDYGLACLLAHELGHTLGLAHTYSGGGASADCNQGPDFLVDVFGNSPSTCPHHCVWGASLSTPWTPTLKVSNNLMGGQGYSYWISGLQAAIMHRSLAHASVRRYLATGCHDCGSCVAFTVRGAGHVSQGPEVPLTYQTTDLNEAWGWSNQAFVAPVRGIYHFDVSFVKDSYYHGGTQDDVRVILNRNGTAIGQAWSGEGAGARGTGCLSLNARLEAGDVVLTMAWAAGGAKRHIAQYNFAGHLVCGCC